MIELLGRIVGTGTLPADLQRNALAMLASVMPPSARPPDQALAPAPGAALLAAAPVITRRLIYVHGICRHPAGFSDPWWSSLHPFVPSNFGDGTLGVTRLEVLWSDVVDQASAALAAVGLAAALPAGAAGPEQARQRAFAEIAEALRDRADQQLLGATMRSAALAAAPLGAADTSGLIAIPGLNCVEDFSIYLVDDGVRQQILDRFIDVLKPELLAGHELDIVAHSWGTVVAYEGLRQLQDEGLAPPVVRNLFTVGAALSIGPVKLRLRTANQDGRKPASVRRWVNLNAHGDIVGGPLKGRPYAVDLDFLNLDATGCGSFLGLVSPACAHGSYFVSGNSAVNRDIFARFIDQA